MRFNGKETEININTKKPEFLAWRWIDLNDLTSVVVHFKLNVYKIITKEIRKLI